MTQKFTIKKVPYLTRNHLIEIADKGEDWDFNRQLCPRHDHSTPLMI